MPSRDFWTEQLEKLGATVKNSVSSKTDVLLVGETYGRNKTEAAQKYGVPTLWFPLAEYLGILDEYSENHLTNLPHDALAQIILIMATIAEDFYVAARNGSPRHHAGFIGVRDAVRELLTSTSGPGREAVR
jgi:hypothetical protein